MATTPEDHRRNEPVVDDASVAAGPADESPAHETLADQQPTAVGADDAEAAPARRRRPPDQTRDDTDAGWGEYADRSAHDRWLEEQRPPHWE